MYEPSRQARLDELDEIERSLRDAHAGRLEGFDLLGRRARRPGDDRARVPHATPRRCGLASDEADDRFGHVMLDEVGGFLFVGAADLMPYGNMPVGTRVRVLPNHACITAAAYDRYYVIDSEFDGGKSVVDIYDRINGW